MKTNTTVLKFTELSCLVSQWNEDRKYALKEYTRCIDDLAKYNYKVDSAKNFLKLYKSEPSAIISKYGAHQTKVMLNEAVEVLKTRKTKFWNFQTDLTSRKKWVKRNTVLRLKAYNAYKWANRIITEMLIDPYPDMYSRVPYADTKEWRDVINSVKNTAKIEFTWTTSENDDYSEEKQKIEISIEGVNKSNVKFTIKEIF